MPRGFPVGVRVMILQIYVISQKNVSKNLIQCTSVSFRRHVGKSFTGKLSNKLPKPFGGGGTELRRGRILYEAEKATSFFSLQPLQVALSKLEPLSVG